MKVNHRIYSTAIVNIKKVSVCFYSYFDIIHYKLVIFGVRSIVSYFPQSPN